MKTDAVRSRHHLWWRVLPFLILAAAGGSAFFGSAATRQVEVVCKFDTEGVDVPGKGLSVSVTAYRDGSLVKSVLSSDLVWDVRSGAARASTMVEIPISKVRLEILASGPFGDAAAGGTIDSGDCDGVVLADMERGTLSFVELPGGDL